MGLFVLGILFGWLVEWLFFNFYWQPNHGNSDSSAGSAVKDLKQQLVEKNSEISTLKSKISAVANVKPKTKKSLVKKAPAPAPAAQAKKKPAKKKATVAAPAAKKVASKKPKSSSFGKELQKISGIGPKLSSTLTESGFDSFEKLAKAKTADLKKLISSSGTKYAMVDVSSWPEQADYLGKGDTAGFEKLLKSLKK